MRWFKHLFSGSASRLFPEGCLQRITDVIAADEARHRGEICFAVESALDWRAVWQGRQARTRAADVFSQLRVWDTRENNGVLIYLLLADHRIEILADRGLEGRVSDEQWRGVCQLMEERLRAGDPEQAVLRGVSAVGDLLAEEFPRIAGQEDRDELPNRPQMLD
jgi:uncharacterized membrane protein